MTVHPLAIKATKITRKAFQLIYTSVAPARQQVMLGLIAAMVIVPMRPLQLYFIN